MEGGAMNKDEMRKQAQDFLRSLNAYDATAPMLKWDHIEADIRKTEAFAREMVVKGMERCKEHHQAQIEYLKPVFSPKDDSFNRTIKTGIEAFQGCVDWIDTEIQRIKEGV